MPDETVRRIGQYELRKVLGKGGMATVWLAYQPSLDREVAIKLMASQFTEDSDFIKRFNQEARSIARLRHPNILAVYEYGQEEGVPYLVTELLEGGTLRERMMKPLDLRAASRIITQVADALDYAHEQGMVHRDIKPSNVLMGQQRAGVERAVLADFGIVKLLSSTAITQTGVGIGTPEYMSPEQAAGEPLDGRSDEYSLGIVLFEMLTGVTPYKADTPLAVLMGHVSRPMPDPRTFNPKIPEEVVQVLETALSKYPAGRYPSAGAFAKAFEQAVDLNEPASTQVLTGGMLPQRPTPTSGKTLERPGATPSYPPGTGSFTPAPGTSGQPFITSAQAYDYAIAQERQGNLQAAFETLADLHRREPAYRDVAAKLEDYNSRHFVYTGQQTVFRPSVSSAATPATNATDSGVYKNPTNVGPFVPQNQTAQGAVAPGQASVPAQTPTSPGTTTSTPEGVLATPAIRPARKNKGLLIGAGIVAAVVVIGGAVLIIALSSNKSVSGQEARVTTAAATTAAATTGVATTSPVTTVATTVPATTSAATTAASTPKATTPAGKPDAVGPQALQISAGIYKQDGDLKDGIDKLKELVKNNPASWTAQRELGRAYYWYVRDKGGLDALKEATTLNDADALSFAYLAMAYSDGFNDAASLVAINRARDLDQNSAEVQAAYAITLLRTDPKQAIDVANKAISLDPENLLANWAAWASYTYTGQYPTADQYINKLLQKYSKFASLASGKGYQYQLAGDNAQARVWYNKALAIDPDFPLAHTGLGTIERLNNNFDGAIKEYQAAIKVYDIDVNAHIGLGYALDAKSRSAEAEAEFRKALALDRNSQEAYNGLAISDISRAVAAANAKDKSAADKFLNDAVAQAEQAITLSPTYADAYFQKGYALFLLQKYSDAKPVLERAVELRADSANYYTILAYTYHQLHDDDSAKRAVDNALKLDPSQPEALSLKKILGG
ncbi:MAG TPA: protein kinase [Chloroflexia bacterium]|nr:protein kinase [Chloroflexia bacterium]